jgi:hypothetical protein
MPCLQNTQANTYYVEWKGALKARGKGWPVRFEPLYGEWTGGGPFTFGWCIRYIKRFYDRIVGIVIIPREELAYKVIEQEADAHHKAASRMVYEWVLIIYIRSHVWHRQIIDAAWY